MTYEVEIEAGDMLSIIAPSEITFVAGDPAVWGWLDGDQPQHEFGAPFVHHPAFPIDGELSEDESSITFQERAYVASLGRTVLRVQAIAPEPTEPEEYEIAPVDWDSELAELPTLNERARRHRLDVDRAGCSHPAIDEAGVFIHCFNCRKEAHKRTEATGPNQ